MKKVLIIVGIVLVVFVIALVVIFGVRGNVMQTGSMDPKDMEISVQKASEETLEETILVTGEIIPEEEQKVFMELENGEIQEFMVEENAQVKAGDTLFVYDETALGRELSAAIRSRDLVKNSISAEENQIASIGKQIEQMKTDRNKQTSEDFEGAFITTEDIRALELEKSQLVLQLEGTRAEAITAQELINDLDDQKAALTVVSKIDGTVVKVNKNLDKTEAGLSQPVIHIVSSEPFKVIGTMSEFDTVNIKADQDVVVRPKVFKDREWKGKVESVSQFPTDSGDGGDWESYNGGSGGVTMYPFKVAILEGTKDLRQGFHVSLEISVGTDKKKLAVPQTALVDDFMFSEDEEMGLMDEVFYAGGFEEYDEGMSFVFVLVDGILEKRDVEIGDMSDEYVEVIDGVELGELVVTTPTPDMYDGMEVASYDEVE